MYKWRSASAICICPCNWNACVPVISKSPPLCVLVMCVCLHECVWPVYVCVFMYAPDSSCTRVLWAVCACLDPYLYSVWLFILPVLLMVQRRIQCNWLFLCQIFHMQPPCLLTLPLILDHRWKPSSHPADAFRFWWAFLFSSQGAESSRTTRLIDGREKICCCFLSNIPIRTFSSAHMFSLQRRFTLKPAQE